VDKLFNPFTLLVGPVLVSIVVYKSTKPVDKGGFHLPWWNVILSYMVWLSATRTAKLIPHLWNRPQDIVYVPAFILFGYYFAVMKIYALLTLHETGWGTRAGVGGATEALNALDAQDAKELGTGTPREKFQNSPSFPSSYPADDGRRYDPEALNYGPPQHQGYAR